MSLDQFHTQLKDILRQAGHTQQQLAVEMGLHPTLLTNKLRGVRKGRLTNPEIKQIIKILAGWEAIFTRLEVTQLLAPMNLSPSIFSPSEWSSPPLNMLETGSPAKTSSVSNAPKSGLEQAVIGQSKLTLSKLVKGNYFQLEQGARFPPYPSTVSAQKPLAEGRLAGSGVNVSRPKIPQALTRLIGREEILDEVENLITREEVRLVNLVGPGGIGKTRVALATAQRLQDRNRFKDGVYFVGLDNLYNPALVAKIICNSLRLPEKKDNSNSLDQLMDFIAGQEMLLVLDNFEHLLEATPTLAHLLINLPGLKLLVTSRITLGIYGEWEYIVPPLPLPQHLDLPTSLITSSLNEHSGAEETEGIANILQNPALALFVERARAVNTRFNMNSQTVGFVIKLCRLLDGVPLALELAAARTRLFDLAKLESLLQQSYLAVLKSEGRMVHQRSERHQSLQASLSWSYSLLNKEEQALFCRLGIFADGFSVETAQAVIPLTASDPYLADQIESLLSQSLLQPEEPGDQGQPPGQPGPELIQVRRYRMLEPLREFGLEHLKHLNTTALEAGIESPDQHQNHLQVEVGARDDYEVWHGYCLYWANWVKKQVDELYGPQVQQSFIRMKQEYANILGALEWGLQNKAHDAVLALAAELALYWIWGTQYNVGTQYLDRVISLTGNLPVLTGDELSLRGKVLYGAGFIAVNQLDFLKAESLLQESLVIFRKLQDKVWLVRVLGGLAFRATSQGQFNLSRQYLDEGLVLSREVGNEARLAASLNNLSVVAIHLKEDMAALAYSKECLNLVRKQHNKVGQAMSLNLLGYIMVNQSQFELARAYLEESLQISREIGHQESLSLTQNVLALNYYRQGNFKLARYHLNEGLRIAFEMGDRFSVLYNLSAQPLVSLKLEAQPAGIQAEISLSDAAQTPSYEALLKAARLLGATDALTNQTNGFAFPRFRELFEEGVKISREGLEAATFDFAWKLGEQMSLEETVDYAFKD